MTRIEQISAEHDHIIRNQKSLIKIEEHLRKTADMAHERYDTK